MKKKTAQPAATKKAKVPKFNYDEHWKEMPEYHQDRVRPIKSLIVHIFTSEDMHKFSKLVGQPITAKTKTIDFPFIPNEANLNKRWSKKK